MCVCGERDPLILYGPWHLFDRPKSSAASAHKIRLIRRGRGLDIRQSDYCCQRSEEFKKKKFVSEGTKMSVREGSVQPGSLPALPANAKVCPSKFMKNYEFLVSQYHVWALKTTEMTAGQQTTKSLQKI